jgi:hypothetical protein
MAYTFGREIMQSSYILPFVDFEGTPEQNEALREILIKLKPAYIRWLRRVVIESDEIGLHFNFSVPFERALNKELPPFLASQGLPEKIVYTRIRPAELHPEAATFFDEIKTNINEEPENWEWMTENHVSAIHYLTQYRFIYLDYDREILGFDWKKNELICRQWIAGIEIAEEAGRAFLKKWSE